eukprot:g15359.t1
MGNTIKHTFAKCRNGREQLLAKEGAPSPPPEQQQKKTGQAPETTVFGRGVRRVSDYSVYDVADAEEDDGPTPGLEDVDVGMPAEDRGAGAGGGAGEEVWGEGFPPPAEAEDVERKKGVLGTPVNACSGGGACTGASSTPARRADTGCTAEQFFQSSPELGEGEHQPPSGELSFDFADRGGEGHVDHKLARKYQDVYPSMNSVSSRGRSLLMQAIVDREWDIAKYLILLQPQEVDESYSHNDLYQTTSTEQPGQETNFQLIDHRCGRTGCTCLTLSLELGQFELAKLVLRHRKFLKVSGKTQFGQDAVSLALAKNARSRPLVSTYIRFYRYL